MREADGVISPYPSGAGHPGALKWWKCTALNASKGIRRLKSMCSAEWGKIWKLWHRTGWMMMSIKYDDITGTHFLLFSVLFQWSETSLSIQRLQPQPPQESPQVTTDCSSSHLETLGACLSDPELGRSFSVFLESFQVVSDLRSDS